MPRDETVALPTWLLFIAPSLIWGTTWLAIKGQLGVVAPEASVAYRFGLASIVLFAWCVARGISLRFDARTHGSLVVLGLLQYSINYVLVYLSEAHLPSGVVAVIFVLTVPWNLAGARVFFGNALSRSIVAGAALGMAGVTLVFLPELLHVSAAVGQKEAIGMAVVATLTSSAGNLWSQRVYARALPIVPSTAWAMGYAAVAVTLWGAFRGARFTFQSSPSYLVSLVYLAVFGSVFAFVAFLMVLRRIGAGRAGYTAAVIPVLAMATSTVFEGYRWSASALLGMAFVVAGVLLVLRAKQHRPASEAL